MERVNNEKWTNLDGFHRHSSLAGDCVEEKDVAAGAADRDVIVVKTENKKKCLLLLKSLVECEEGTRKHTFIS